MYEEINNHLSMAFSADTTTRDNRTRSASEATSTFSGSIKPGTSSLLRVIDGLHELNCGHDDLSPSKSSYSVPEYHDDEAVSFTPTPLEKVGNSAGYNGIQLGGDDLLLTAVDTSPVVESGSVDIASPINSRVTVSHHHEKSQDGISSFYVPCPSKKVENSNDPIQLQLGGDDLSLATENTKHHEDGAKPDSTDELKKLFYRYAMGPILEYSYVENRDMDYDDSSSSKGSPPPGPNGSLKGETKPVETSDITGSSTQAVSNNKPTISTDNEVSSAVQTDHETTTPIYKHEIEAALPSLKKPIHKRKSLRQVTSTSSSTKARQASRDKLDAQKVNGIYSRVDMARYAL